MTEDGFEFGFFDKGIEHDVYIKTFGTVAAPLVLFCANIAATEKCEVLRELKEFLADLIFVHAAQETEIEDFVRKVVVNVVLEVSFELKAFGILMIDVCADDIALVCACLV